MQRLSLYCFTLAVIFNNQEFPVFCAGLAGPSQIDLESEKTLTICTSQKRSLTCGSPGSTIAITDVFWGRQSRDVCPSDDGDEHVDCGAAKETPGIVRNICESKAACQLEAKHKVLQNPETRHCPGVNKYLQVSYTCVPDAKEVTVCDGEQTTLKCPASFKTFINSVFWGRQSVNVCPADNGLSMCTGASESLDMLKKKCDGGDKCDITASYNEVQNGGENCPGIQKYLIINYSCKPAGAKDEDSEQDDGDNDSDDVMSKSLPSGNNVHLTTTENNRLGTGGLKALEKVNTLIKKSDGEITDDQEKAIERMIIGGLEDTQKQKTVDVMGTPKTSIPKLHSKSGSDMNKQIMELAKLVDEATSKINYKKATVAKPQTINGNVKKAVKRLNVPHPMGFTQHSTTLNKVNTTSTVRRNWLKKTNKRNSIYGKITPHL
ncbi:uncharacterized protein LOC124433675 isoform X2 [Xenia sp. Carnegie-2017]|uniref:uncharacterized protein LOC124433675 isoform X2 n=1 Tax=Xenia sp. Carnegie-2017 TaxID=2897299 RepID=UPI001F03533F|nr:uncharacterized protein LOC124433675 isoform X2 [Xenia sp. Carnegie-2017]